MEVAVVWKAAMKPRLPTSHPGPILFRHRAKEDPPQGQVANAFVSVIAGAGDPSGWK